MNRIVGAAGVLLALALTSAACQSSSLPSGPSSLSAAPGGLFDVGPNGASLKASAPIPQTPVGNVVATSLTPAFIVTGGLLAYATDAVQYRFRVTDAAGAVIDSGLTGPVWTPAAPLTPRSNYQWVARTEYRGGTGPWSTTAFFTTPVAPGNDYGAWESVCQTVVNQGPPAVVNCVWQFVKPTNSFDDLEIVKRVAWLLRSQGLGLLLKSSGENVVPWMGMNFSASRVCYNDGHIYKIIGDAGLGGVNSPGWSDNDFVDVSLYQPAIDPRLR